MHIKFQLIWKATTNAKFAIKPPTQQLNLKKFNSDQKDTNKTKQGKEIIFTSFNHQTEKRMSKQTYKVCFCFRRRYRHTVSVAPPEIKTLFENYSDKGLMTTDLLHRFLIDVQKQDKATREEAQAIVNASSSLLHRNGLHLDAFFKYLFGITNSPLSSHEVI